MTTETKYGSILMLGFQCPACGADLWWHVSDTTLYCGWGKCPSKVSNEGAMAPTPELALPILEKMVETEHNQ